MAERGTNKILLGYLCAIGTEIIFGMSYIFTKQGCERSKHLCSSRLSDMLFFSQVLPHMQFISTLVERETQFSGAEITYIMLAAGAFVYTLIAIIEAITQDNLGFLVTLPFKNTAFLTAVLYQGIGCSILAFFMSNVAIANIGVKQECFAYWYINGCFNHIRSCFHA